MTRLPSISEQSLQAILARTLGLDGSLPSLEADQSDRLWDALALTPWTTPEAQWIEAEDYRPKGAGALRLEYWDQRRGLTLEMLHVRLQTTVPPAVLTDVAVLGKQLSRGSTRQIRLSLLEAVCAEANVSLAYVLGETWERPYYLLELLSAIELAHVVARKETQEVIGALAPLMLRLRGVMRSDPGTGAKALSELAQMVRAARPEVQLNERLAPDD